MTLLEVMVSTVVMAMVSLLLYGAYDSMSRSKRAESLRVDRARQGREALLRIVRDMSSAYLSMHAPPNQSLRTTTTTFQARNGSPFDRVDFACFAHRRVEKDAKESDQAEVGFFVTRDPDVSDKMDLVRREQYPIDTEGKKGGMVSVLAENVEQFDLRFLDPQSGTWTDSWDSTQAAGQLGRLPLEVRVSLTMKAVPGDPARTYSTKFFLPIQQPLAFGISQ
jgi:general secretion pathway protein J